MANEAVMVQKLQTRLPTVTVADGIGLAKGTILVSGSNPNTAVASSGDGDLFVGILAEEKEADDGQTEVAVYTEGIFAIKCAPGGTATLHSPVKVAGANLIDVADDSTIANSREVVGIASETGANNEVIQVRLGFN